MPKLSLTIFHVQRYMSNYKEYEKEQKEMALFSERKENCHVRLNFMIFFTKQKNPQIAEDSEFNRRSNSRVNQLLVNSLM